MSIREELAVDPDWPGNKEISNKNIVTAEDSIRLVIMVVRSQDT